MPSPALINQNIRAGMCPHGLPQAACPICSGGGIAGGSIKKFNKPSFKSHSSDNWSFMKCYMAGIAIRSRQNHILNMKDNLRRQLEFADNLRKGINNIHSKLQNVLADLKNSIPPSLHKPMDLALKFIFNTLNKLPDLIKNFAELQKDIYSKLLSAYEKLTAILGDFKNFIQRKFTENLKQKLKKLYLFFIVNSGEENYNDDETLAVFKSREMKKYIVKILNKFTKKENNND